MALSAQTLKHEYRVYIDEEIERYKESVPRDSLLTIAQAAATAIGRRPQVECTELILREEVDRIIVRRLKVPTFRAWQSKRVELLEYHRETARWTMSADASVIESVVGLHRSHVLLANVPDTDPVLYLAAHGCRVTVLDTELDMVERVLYTAARAGLTGHVDAQWGSLATWSASSPLSAVVMAPTALSDLDEGDRGRAVEALQLSTVVGGIHVLRTVGALGKRVLSVEQLRGQYRGWDVTIERSDGRPNTFLARKSAH